MPDKLPTPPTPPPNLLIPELNSPDHTNTFFVELVSRQSDRFLALNPIKRGTLYADCPGADATVVKSYGDLFFCKETVPKGSNTVSGMNQSEWVIWHWMSGEDSESTYNAEISYLGDAIGNPVFARVYTVRRTEYEAGPTLPNGGPLTALIGVNMKQPGFGYKHAKAIFDCGGDGAEVEFVISKGQIISAIVTKEGQNFNPDSQITIEGDGSGATCSPIIQPQNAILTSQKKIELPESDPLSHEFVRVLRVYEFLPGPYIPFTRYDDDLGPIQGRRRAVLNTGQVGGIITPTSKTNYEGRDGSSIVSIELQENWSDGTGTPGNPIYPTLYWSTYSDERGTVQHSSQIQVSHGTLDRAILIRPAPGQMLKVFFEPYADNPFLEKQIQESWTEVTINDQKKISEFGGGIIDVIETTDEPGVQSPDKGLMVVSSETRTKSPHEQTLRTEKNPLAAWPVLIGRHTDETTGIVVNYTKQVILAGTPYPGTDRTGHCTDPPNTSPPVCCFGNKIQGPFIEDQPYDEDKTIRIISAVDLHTLPDLQCWSILHPVNFPPQLLSVEAIWTDAVSKTVQASQDGNGNHTAFAEASSGSNGGAVVTASSGFRGYAKGRQERSYFYGPPNAGLVPSALKIIPSSGSIVFTATDSKTTNSQSEDGGLEFHDEFKSQAHATDVRDHLVGSFDISGALGDVVVGTKLIHKSPPQSAVASSGTATASVLAAGTNSTMEVRIPQSTPAQLTSGQTIIMEVAVREHPFGIWTMDVIYVTVP
jgi:hypothetical protein